MTDLAQLREALALPVDRILLDNMSLDEMRAAVEIAGGRIPLEASGGVNLQTVAAIARHRRGLHLDRRADALGESADISLDSRYEYSDR